MRPPKSTTMWSSSFSATVPSSPGSMPGVLEVVQQVLGLVLEAHDADPRADLDVAERHADDAVADVDRMPVRARLGVADRGEHARLEHRRHRVLEPLGLLVHLVPRDPEHVGEEALDQPVAADDALGVLAPVLGEGEHLVGAARDVAVALEPADHLVHGRRRELHRARDVRPRHRQAGLLEPEDGLEVLLLGDGGVVVRHAVILSSARLTDAPAAHRRRCAARPASMNARVAGESCALRRVTKANVS